MKFHILVLITVITLLGTAVRSSAQTDSVIGQVTNSTAESFAGGISGDGRYIVFESTGNLATENPDNSDGNREIFLFDYAQRRIFQITHTKSLLTNATLAPTFDNIKVEIVNHRPAISNDGLWIAFSSNATCAYPGNGTILPIVSTTNPGSFEPNATTGNDCVVGTTNNLVNDGNTEIWLYQIPVAPPVTDLSIGDEIAVTNLSGGTFTRVTNSLPSRLPIAGTTSTTSIIADDNRDASIDDTADGISFTSNRDLITGGNASPAADNDEIFVYLRGAASLKQITTTPRGTIGNPINNANSTISNLTAGGWRVAFISNANNAITGQTGTTNSDNNEEVFVADLDAAGAITTRRQITTTTRTNPGDIVNVLTSGRRMSRDGRFIAVESYVDLVASSPGAVQTSFATYVYDVTAGTYRQVLLRSDADANASGGDIQRYLGFSDYDANRSPANFVLETRMNIKPDGTIPTTASEGLNDNAVRPAQLYTYPVAVSTGAIFKRITKFPAPLFALNSIQPLTSNSSRRMTFNLSQVEAGTGNFDLLNEVMYLVTPNVDNVSPATLNLSTGASRIAVSPTTVPTPSPTPTPTATPTPSPTPTPTTTPSPTPTPTPQQPAAVKGVSPGMLAVVDIFSGTSAPVVARTAVGSLERSFTLPIELSGVTMTIGGAACGLKTVGRRQITFVVPPGLTGSAAGTSYPIVINNNGVVYKGTAVLVAARPDIFTKNLSPSPGGRALIFNATNRVLLTEPFPIRTFRLRGSKLVPTVLRLRLTGVKDVVSTGFQIRIGGVEVPTGSVLTAATLVEPGVYTVDFTIPSAMLGNGDQPIVVSVTADGATWQSRLDDTAPRVTIL